MKKLIIASFLLLGIGSLTHATQSAGGSFRTFMPSSGVVFNDGGTLMAVQCSTPGSSAVNLNQYYALFFDTSVTPGAGFIAPGGVALPVVASSTQIVTPPLIFVSSLTTGGANGAMFLGADYSNFGGIHINNDLFFFLSERFFGTGCTVFWRREFNN